MLLASAAAGDEMHPETTPKPNRGYCSWLAPNATASPTAEDSTHSDHGTHRLSQDSADRELPSWWPTLAVLEGALHDGGGA